MSTIISAGTTTNTAYNVNPDTSGSMVLATGSGPTAAVTISSSQVATFAQAPVLPSGSIPQAALAANVAGNGPAFSVEIPSTQSLSASTNTLLQNSVKTYDTAGCFNNTGSTTTLNGLSVPAYSFCPNVAGYYYLTGLITINATGTSGSISSSLIFKNGSQFLNPNFSPQSTVNFTSSTQSYLVYLNGTGDYVGLYAYQNSSSTQTIENSVFQGFLARSA